MFWRLLVWWTVLLLPMTLAAQMITPQPPWELDITAPIGRGLVAWYPLLPGRSGGTRLWNLRRHVHGVVSGAQVTSNTRRRFPLVLAFNGTSDVIDVDLSGWLIYEANRPFSFVTTFASTASVPGNMIAKLSDTFPFPGVQLLLRGGQLELRMNDAVNNRAVMRSDTTWNDGLPHTAVATYDGSGQTAGIKLYVDGALQPAQSIFEASLTDVITNTFPLRFGASINGEFYAGTQTNMFLYNIALSPMEALAHAQMQAPAYGGLLVDTPPRLGETVRRKGFSP
jgi:hypothetical protein